MAMDKPDARRQQQQQQQHALLTRKDDRIVIHFDYDCFYASVFENENPALKSVPLAVQQKFLIVTCNYEARRWGLRKLQSVVDAKRQCPDLVVVLGEDLTRFRNASKDLYTFLRSFSWNGRVERLGFDEVWMDVTDVVDYNISLLNRRNLQDSFFQISRSDPLLGFPFDATVLAGYAYDRNSSASPPTPDDEILNVRLVLASHFALHIRHRLEEQKGYTCTVGISTNKLLSKLVGNLHKPKNQTTLLPPYSCTHLHLAGEPSASNVHSFLDDHDIGSIPYIGFKAAQRLRTRVLGRDAAFEDGLMYGATKENVVVSQVRGLPDLSPAMLEKLLSGPGVQHGVGLRVFGLVNGIDDTQVAPARNVPRQISIEDSYMQLNSFDQVVRELHMLSRRLIERMRVDLMADEVEPNLERELSHEHEQENEPALGHNQERQSEIRDAVKTSDRSKSHTPSTSWLAKPQTIRLSTRARPPRNADGTRMRSFARSSRSTHAPAYMFSLVESADALAAKLVSETLLPLFRRLHHEKGNWDLTLVNVAVTGMDERVEMGGDIGSVFKRQVELRKEWESNVLPFVVEDNHISGANGPDGKQVEEGKKGEVRELPAAEGREQTANVAKSKESEAAGDVKSRRIASQASSPAAAVQPLEMDATTGDEDLQNAIAMEWTPSQTSPSSPAVTQRNSIGKMEETADSEHGGASEHFSDAWQEDDGVDDGEDDELDPESRDSTTMQHSASSAEVYLCPLCGNGVPLFAREAHERFHKVERI